MIIYMHFFLTQWPTEEITKRDSCITMCESDTVKEKIGEHLPNS